MGRLIIEQAFSDRHLSKFPRNFKALSNVFSHCLRYNKHTNKEG